METSSLTASSKRAAAQSTYLVSLPVDFLLIGGASILLFVLLPYFYEGPMTPRLLSASLWLTWLGTWPHNAATNYRLYSTKNAIRQYPFTAVGVPILVLVGVLASFAAPDAVAPYFIKITLTWVLYHYCGQSIGISLLYARRANYRPSVWERFLLVSFFYGTFFCKSLVSETSARSLQYFGVAYPRFGVPVFFTYVAAAWCYCAAAGFLFLLLRQCIRERRLPPLMYLLPAVTHYVWFFVADPERPWVQFVPFFHGLQYLVIAWAMQLKQEADQRGTAATSGFFLLKSLRWYAINLVGGACLFWVTPRLVSALGGVDLRFASAVIFTAFQVQHSFVDGVIWKLRTRSVVSPLLVHVPALFRSAPESVLT
jgi:hypothetical protein